MIDRKPEIDASATSGRPVSPHLEEERRRHEAFAESRRRVYVEHAELLETLDRFVDASDGERGLVVTGESGSGKSALLANWAQRLRRRAPHAFVLEHYVGASDSSRSHVELIRRLMLEIRERYALTDQIPTTREALEEEVPVWLARPHGETLVLVIDAVDQLADGVTSIEWLPAYLAPSVRIVLSTTPGPLEDELLAREWPALVLPPLSTGARTDIARRFLADLDLEIAAEPLRRLTSSVPAANPLFLQTSLREAKASRSGDGHERTIDHFLSATSLEILMERVIERIEEDLGAELVGRALRLLAASRDGLHAEELGGILRIDDATLSDLLERASHHLIHRGGALAFAHESLRESVDRRYFRSSPEERRRAHLGLAEFFAHASSPARRAREAPWQWRQAGDHARLLETMTDPRIAVELAADPLNTDLIEYWTLLRDSADLVASYRTALERFERTMVGDEELARACSAVGALFNKVGEYEQAAEVLRRAHALQIHLPGHRADLVRTTLALGHAELSRGNVAEAEVLLREAVAIAAADPELARTEWPAAQRELILVLYASRRYAEALPIVESALESSRPSSPAARALAVQLAGDRAAIRMALHGVEGATQLFEGALDLARHTFGEAHPETATALNNLGAVLMAEGKPAEAIAPLTAARETWSRLLGPSHPLISRVLTNIGLALQHARRTSEAKRAYEEAIEIDRAAGLDGTIDHATTLTNFALLLKEGGQLEAARRNIERALAIYSATFGPDHFDTVQAEIELAHLHYLEGRLDEALRLYDLYVPKKAALLGAGNPSVERSERVRRLIRDEIERRHTTSTASRNEGPGASVASESGAAETAVRQAPRKRARTGTAREETATRSGTKANGKASRAEKPADGAAGDTAKRVSGHSGRT